MLRIAPFLLHLVITSCGPALPALAKDSCQPPAIERQVGALLLIGFSGTTPDSPGVLELRSEAEAGRIAGAVFMGYNIENPTQVRRLTAFMGSWNTPQPFIVAIDQEGGAVARLPAHKGFVPLAAALDVAEDGNEQAYNAMAEELADLGFNLNFGPVVDLAVDPEGPAIGARRRAFGRTNNTVQHWAKVFIDAHRRVGVRTTLKHFPGHGSATSDSHHGLTDITAHWSSHELQPFYGLIEAGYADSVMSAHLTHKELDGRWPLSLSPTFMEHHLRQAAHYNGAVISDALDMGALWRFYSLEDITVAAIGAGNDLLIFSMNAAAHGGAAGYENIDQLPQRATEAVRQALGDGRLTQEQLERAYERATAFAQDRCTEAIVP